MERAYVSTPFIVPWLLVLLGFSAQMVGVHLMASRLARSETVEGAALESDGEGPDSVRFVLPIDGARVPDNPDHLPGASRAYRGGQHEGVDFRCRPGTPVHAAADGFVLSIDDEPNLPERRRNELLDYCQRRGETPEVILDALHGQRVVVCHRTLGGELVTTSYSHLQDIDSLLKPGSEVRRNQVIGWAGNSGTSHAYRNDGWGELHFELRINGRPVGIGLAAGDAAALYRQYLGGASHD